MSIFPHTGNDAEDQMAQVPILFCCLPLAIVAIIAGIVLAVVLL